MSDWFPNEHVFIHFTGANQILDTSFDFAVVDSNSLLFVFKHAPEVVKELHVNSDISFSTSNQSHFETWKVRFKKIPDIYSSRISLLR